MKTIKTGLFTKQYIFTLNEVVLPDYTGNKTVNL